MLTIENLTYSFPGSNPIFADIDLIVNDMESVLISGYSRYRGKMKENHVKRSYA